MALTLPNFASIATSAVRPPNGIKVLIINKYSGPTPSESGEWPEYVSFPPRVGDSIQSINGTIKKITEVIHFADHYGNPGVALRLGDDNTTVTPTEGGGGGMLGE